MIFADVRFSSDLIWFWLWRIEFWIYGRLDWFPVGIRISIKRRERRADGGVCLSLLVPILNLPLYIIAGITLPLIVQADVLVCLSPPLHLQRALLFVPGASRSIRIQPRAAILPNITPFSSVAFFRISTPKLLCTTHPQTS